ncbi:MAG: hypothetical protein O6940_01645, partial [Ignavibacteria bacterium]|nr:hypothetical protein [Ignavibacteria bacterium]
MRTFFIIYFIISITLCSTSAQIITITEAIEDLNGDLIPDRLGDTVTVLGINFSPNFGGYYSGYYIDDGTAATRIYQSNILMLNLGDEVQITGFVYHHYGATTISGLDTTSITLMSTGNPLPDPIVLTLAQYLTDPEAYEGSLIGFISLTMVGGTWPSPGNYANVQISDGIDTLNMFIDNDTDISNYPEPTWPMDIIGIGNQYTTSTPPNDDYQLLPRYYSDFLPAGTLPVELTSFTANVNNNGHVVLNWSTETELNNQMFEIERRIEEDQYVMIGYVNGHGTTTESQEYSYIDNTVETGTFFYRLKQIDFLGTYEYSDEIEVQVNGPLTFGLE